ncbi:MAG: prolyl oligopeptidase family serine peptidase [Undibacterium sp.]|nr:prolyl oligopeptidase family serine peptidase [Opitutaceae bacterium]
MSRRHLIFLLLLAGACLPFARGAPTPFEKFVTNLYRPWQAEQVALSPDGEHLAYTRHEAGNLVIEIMTVSRPAPKFKIIADDDQPVLFAKELRPAYLRFLAWASPTRLVFAPVPKADALTSITAVNRDGTAPMTLAAPDDFAVTVTFAPPGVGGRERLTQRSIHIVGFAPGHRETLLIHALGTAPMPYATDVPTTLVAIDVTTGKKTELAEETNYGRYLPHPGGNLHLLYSQPRYATTRIFELKKPGFWDRWITLDEAWGGPLTKAFKVTPENYHGERAFPLGFDVDPDLLYYASNVGRDTYGIYALDVRKKQRTPFAVEEPHVDLALPEPGDPSPLVFDPITSQLVGVRGVGVAPFTRWIDPEFATLQQDLEKKFPQRTVELLQWDDARRRLLLRVTGGIEPGRYHVFQRPENVMVEVLRSAPWLRNADLHRGTTFAFDTPGGAHLTGYLTFPSKPRINPPPLLIDFSDGVMGSAQPGFHRQAQVLAELGFIVARVNHRGMSGFGLAHRNAFRDGGDRVPVDDALAAINWIAGHHAIDRKRMATFGRGLGGYLALRALQLEPDVFRCAVAIDAPLAPALWLMPPLEDLGPGSQADAADYKILLSSRPPPPIDFAQEVRRAFLLGGSAKLTSVLSHVETLTKPVMLIVNRPEDDPIALQNAFLRAKLSRQGLDPELLQTANPFAADLPLERAKTFRRIGEFFNLNLYDYGVKVGPTKEIK